MAVVFWKVSMDFQRIFSSSFVQPAAPPKNIEKSPY